MRAVIYYSRSGENYVNGQLKQLSKGNTMVVAEKIADYLEAELIRLIPKKDYPDDYQEMVELAEQEKKEQKHPEYQAIIQDISNYDELFIGYPNWWGTFPQVIATFLKQQELSGKTIYPFCTHEGSAMGTSVSDMIRLCPNAKIETGLAVRGSKAAVSDKTIANWLNHLIK
ncbi:NAD(P)H-dependent oxidoreductase [Enterococcus sp. BWM-S5]|uniref:NAD(P)H-dependent oxidoreductase n=1 Tax=Enterococcus larvae TaxID=2794352 RepID=A0ABS4CP98_9ENTE|nr:flavodoxin [Enterococcus larvae]MBP1048390.1 NAD(P)H-dependent oxidoreductase [Enterococcus larvae]